MYELGAILKSILRGDDCPLYVMICNDGTVGQKLDQDDYQFEAVVLFDADTEEHKVGEVHNNWNKGVNRWMSSSLQALANDPAYNKSLHGTPNRRDV